MTYFIEMLRPLIRSFLCLVVGLCLGLAALAPRAAQAQDVRTVAGTFDFGIVGKQGKNAGTLNDLRNFSTLGLRISFFAFDNLGYGGTQGNDDAGFLRMISYDGQLVDISGSINWQIKQQGSTVYIGIVPDNLASPRTIQTPIGPYTIDGTSSFAVRLPGKTLTYADGSNVKGSANPPAIADIPTQEVTTVPGPPAAFAQARYVIQEGNTDVADLNTSEWVSWVFSGGADADLFDIDPVSGMLVFKSPPDFYAPRDAGGDNIYDLEITVWDLDGQSRTQTTQVEVTPIPPDIASSKAVRAASVSGQPFDCAAEPALVGAGEMIPGTCVTYRIEIANAAAAGPAEDLQVVDNMPAGVFAVAIFATEGFDGTLLEANRFTGTIARFAPGQSAWVEIRALLQ